MFTMPFSFSFHALNTKFALPGASESKTECKVGTVHFMTISCTSLSISRAVIFLRDDVHHHRVAVQDLTVKERCMPSTIGLQKWAEAPKLWLWYDKGKLCDQPINSASIAIYSGKFTSASRSSHPS